MNLPVIPHDKCLHAIYGAASAFVGLALISMPAGALLCFGVAAGKELYDKATGRGTPDVLDFAATLIGGGFVCAAAVLG